MGTSREGTSGEQNSSISRRTAAKISGVAAAGGSVLLGFVTDAVDIDLRGESAEAETGGEPPAEDVVPLPRPHTTKGNQQIAQAIADRRSRREYPDEPVTKAELGQLLWAAQGITQRNVGYVDFRAAPSAGGTYPLTVFVVSGRPGVSGMSPGIFRYRVDEHDLRRIEDGTFGERLQEIGLDQEWIGAAALNIVIAAVDERTTQRYGPRGRRRYVPMEAGHAGQNIYLQAESLGLSTVAIGAFRDDELRELLDLDDSYRPLYIYPVGRRA